MRRRFSAVFPQPLLPGVGHVVKYKSSLQGFVQVECACRTDHLTAWERALVDLWDGPLLMWAFSHRSHVNVHPRGGGRWTSSPSYYPSQKMQIF